MRIVNRFFLGVTAQQPPYIVVWKQLEPVKAFIAVIFATHSVDKSLVSIPAVNDDEVLVPLSQ